MPPVVALGVEEHVRLRWHDGGQHLEVLDGDKGGTNVRAPRRTARVRPVTASPASALQGWRAHREDLRDAGLVLLCAAAPAALLGLATWIGEGARRLARTRGRAACPVL